MVSKNTKKSQRLASRRWIVAVIIAACAAAGGYAYFKPAKSDKGHSEVSSQSRRGAQNFTPTPAEWATLVIEPVKKKVFRAEFVTEGKVAVDEDRSTPVFSP